MARKRPRPEEIVPIPREAERLNYLAQLRADENSAAFSFNMLNLLDLAGQSTGPQAEIVL